MYNCQVITHPLKDLIPTLPTLPGSYLFKDKSGQVIYVGKAKNLRKRVSSYLQNYHDLTPRLQIMVDNAVNVEVHTVDSEVEALILEATLIKKYKPKYNVLLKDDKSYSWIKITKDPYPIIYRTRNTRDKNAVYFGPFPSAQVRDQLLSFLRRQFPYRTCSLTITDEDNQKRQEMRKNGQLLRSRLCTYYHICRCPGPCEGLISRNEYLANINSIKKFLRNKKQLLTHELENKMRAFAAEEEFEKAAKIKQQIDELNNISKSVFIGYGDDEDDVRQISYQRAMKGLEGLIKDLNIGDYRLFMPGASKLYSKTTQEIKEMGSDYLDAFRIECFDISNTVGTNPVGSMVVFVGGLPYRQHYRKFKINVKSTPDDYAMMKEMLVRRFRYIKAQVDLRDDFALQNQELMKKYGIQNSSLKLLTPKTDHSVRKVKDDSFAAKPDLVIIDGGKGQLNVALEVLHDLKIDGIAVCSLAKRREEIFLPNEKTSHLYNDKKEILFLIQNIRNEAHRFGLTFHRQRRSKAMFD